MPLICSFAVLVFDGLPRFFIFPSPFVVDSSFFFFGVATFFVGDGVAPVFGGRPRARFGVSEAATLPFDAPEDFG